MVLFWSGRANGRALAMDYFAMMALQEFFEQNKDGRVFYSKEYESELFHYYFLENRHDEGME